MVDFYRDRYARLISLYREQLNRDLLGEFARLEGEGVLELATCGPILFSRC